MLLYYAMGGGLGHLTRARAFSHTLGLDGEVTLFTSSRFAEDPRVTGGLPVVRVPEALDGNREGVRALLEETLTGLEASDLVVDAFPAGLLGELAGWTPPVGLALRHVARLLRWERYAADVAGRLPHFDLTYTVEELLPDHRRALEAVSREVRPLELRDPPASLPPPVAAPYVLVVHAGSDEETIDLVECARDLLRFSPGGARILLASPARPAALPDEVGWLDIHPASGLFAGAEQIVGAAGFNLVRQTAAFREKRFLVPFPRRFDDPFTRAARANRCNFSAPPVS